MIDSTNPGNYNNGLGAKIFFALVKLIGLRGVRIIAAVLGVFCFYFIPIRKKVVIQNLTCAFPEKPPKEINRIARNTYKSILTTFFEMLFFPVSTRDEIKELVEWDPRRLTDIKNRTDSKKGTIFLTAHFGSWEAAGLGGAIHYGVPFKVLAQKQSSDFYNRFLIKAREVYGNKTIWLGKSVRHVYEALKNGEVVGIVGDQRGPSTSRRISFFGRQTALYPGTAYFILKTRCNVVVGFAIRQPANNYKIETEFLSLENLPEEENDAIREINQRYMSILERYVSKYPSQYFWMHKIWKY